MHTNILKDEITEKVRQENCFDFLRYLFAISLILAHFCTLTGTEQFWFITGSMRVKAFFTITGFLVTYSFLRRANILSYAKKRFVRIVPAYVICIFFCFIVGGSVSKMSYGDFILNSQTWKYLVANIFMLNWIEPELPQTFQSNPLPQMNGSLWSMKQEVLFYILVPILIWCMRNKHTRNIICFLILATCILSYNYVNHQTEYFMFFLSGMIMLLYFNIICAWKKFLIPIAFFALVPVYVVNIPYISDICRAFESLCFPIMILGVAYNAKPLNFQRRYDNITYGLYLYHFPVIQLLILYGFANYNLSLCLIATFLITSLLAYISWHYIEKPLMDKYK